MFKMDNQLLRVPFIHHGHLTQITNHIRHASYYSINHSHIRDWFAFTAYMVTLGKLEMRCQGKCTDFRNKGHDTDLQTAVADVVSCDDVSSFSPEPCRS